MHDVLRSMVRMRVRPAALCPPAMLRNAMLTPLLLERCHRFTIAAPVRSMACTSLHL